MRESSSFWITISLLVVAESPSVACPLAARASDIHLTSPTNVEASARFGMRQHPILGYAKFHTGWDYDAAIGTPVRAAAPGRVAAASYVGHYGNLVVIDHGGGVETAYAHLSRIEVVSGACVDAGTSIGDIGATGLSADPHLHFEIRKDGNAVDPASWLEK